MPMGWVEHQFDSGCLEYFASKERAPGSIPGGPTFAFYDNLVSLNEWLKRITKQADYE